MPELPEVETVKKYLSASLIGMTVKECRFKASRVVDETSINAEKYSLKRFQSYLTGQTLKRIDRKGKYLIFIFSKSSVLSNLGMSGRMLIEPKTKAPKKNISTAPKITNPITQKEIFSAEVADKHLYWWMDFGKCGFSFYDPRTFGKVIPILDHQFEKHPRFSKLGRDAHLSNEDELMEIFNNIKKINKLKNISKLNRGKNLKNFLLDQSKISGIGNIYADESLFMAGLRPTRLVSQLNLNEWKRLVGAIKVILEKAIENQGTSFGKSDSDYRRPDHGYGEHQESLKVYGKKDEPCTICGKELSYLRIAGRSTVYCKTCQK